MKRLFCLLLALMLVTLWGCQGNFGSVDLKAPMEIPQDGKISKSTLEQIKAENAIGVFTGTQNGLKYEWTIFGSDISETKEINLGVELTPGEELTVKLAQSEPFGFSALLSVYLDDNWQAQSATAYAGDTPVASVSITGSKTTILNLTLDGSVTSLVIRPDALPEDAVLPTTPEAPETTQPVEKDYDYLSGVTNSDDKVYTDGKDKYHTDPIPEGKPKPVEPEDQQVNQEKTYTCTFSIECTTILNNLDQLDPEKLELVPTGGVILEKTTVTFQEGESVFDVLQRICKEKGIHMEAEWTPIYNSAYVEGIHNLYEFDCGSLSGWMYRVNGWYPNYGCSRYQLKEGDLVQWRYTCDLGNDVGGAYAVGG